MSLYWLTCVHLACWVFTKQLMLSAALIFAVEGRKIAWSMGILTCVFWQKNLSCRHSCFSFFSLPKTTFTLKRRLFLRCFLCACGPFLICVLLGLLPLMHTYDAHTCVPGVFCFVSAHLSLCAFTPHNSVQVVFSFIYILQELFFYHSTSWGELPYSFIIWLTAWFGSSASQVFFSKLHCLLMPSTHNGKIGRKIQLFERSSNNLVSMQLSRADHNSSC